MDRTKGETFTFRFTTRAFATGIPTALAGSPVLSAMEDAVDTPITTGVSLTASSVAGLTLCTIDSSQADFEAGKEYDVYISTGTVGGVSVVGEVVGHFSLSRGAAAVDLANGTDGLGALKTLIDDVPTVAEFEARTIVAASYFDPAADAVANVTLVATTTTNTDMRGTDSAALASVATEARLAELDAANLPTDIAAIPTTAMRGTDGANTTAPDNAGIAAIQAKTDDLTFTKANELDSNIQSVNDVTVTGTGAGGDEWGP